MTLAWAGIPQYWEAISNPVHFTINSEGDQLHLPKVK